jgi:hypothetical protein
LRQLLEVDVNAELLDRAKTAGAGATSARTSDGLSHFVWK